MNETIRERLGKAAYEARQREINAEMPVLETIPWETWTNAGMKEWYRIEAEATVLSFAELFMPVIKNMLSEDEIKRLLKTLE